MTLSRHVATGIRQITWEHAFRTHGPLELPDQDAMRSQFLALVEGHAEGRYEYVISTLKPEHPLLESHVGWGRKALAHLGLFQYKRAFECCEKAIDLSSCRSRRVRSKYLTNKAVILAQSGDPTTALEVLEEALELCPDRPSLWVNMLAMNGQLGLHALRRAVSRMLEEWHAWSESAELQHHLRHDITLRPLRRRAEFRQLFKLQGT